MSNFLSIGEGFQPKSDAVTMAEDEKGTVAAFTGISESVTESGLLQDFPTADFIVVKSEPACSPEKEWNTGLGSSLLTPSSNTTPAQVLERLGSPPNSTPDDLSSKMNNFLSTGEDFQPNSDPRTVPEDETGTVAASTRISESVSESGLPQDYPAADLIVLKSEPACSPEKDTRDSNACFDLNPHTNDVEPVSGTVPPSERVHEVLSQITTSSGQVKSDTAEQLCSAYQNIDVVGWGNDSTSSEHHSEVYELPSLDHDYCITSDMFKKGRSRCYRRKSPLLPRVELPDIPTDRQERIQERIQEKRMKWLPRGITGKSRVIPRVDLANRFTQPRNGNRKLIEAHTLVHKRSTLAIKFDPGPDVTVRGTSVCKVKDEANEESSGLKEVEMEEKQEEKKEKEEKEKEEEEEEEWLEWSESESEEQYDSRDPDYLPYPADRKDTVKVEGPFKRKATGKRAPSRLERQRYYMIQFMTLPKCFRCTSCPASFSSVHEFDKHIDSNHDKEGKMFRSELLQLLEKKKTPEVLERYKEELRKRGYNPEAELKRCKCLEKPKDISECQLSPVTIESGTRMQARASEKRTDQEGMMMMRMDEGEGDWSHLSGEGQPENINPADVGTVGTIWGKEGQRKDDGGVQNHGCCNDTESLISKNHSGDATDLQNLQELCIEEGEKKEKSISRERTILEESLEDHCLLSHDETPLCAEENKAAVVSAVVSSPAQENSSRFENQEIGGKETISVEGTDAVNIPVSNESAEMALDDISDLLTSMLGEGKTLSSELTDKQFGTTCEAGLLNLEEELEADDSERREESPDGTLMDQEDDAEQSTDIGMHDEQEGLKTYSTACRSENVANAESELKDEPKSFSFDQDIDIIWWMNSWSHISFECDVCKRDISFSRMRSHMLRHEKVRHCMVCNNWFVSETQYESHLPGCEEKKPCACEYCGKSFKNLPLHISLMHSTPSKEKVRKKKESWDGHKWRKNMLKKHLRLARRYRCRICVESFLSILEFGNHMNSSHAVQGEVFRSELLQLLEEKKTPEVLERYKEELRKRGLNPEAVGRRRPPSIQFQRRTRMQTRASKRRTEQEGMVGKTNDEGDRDHGHLSGDGQPENIHPAEVSVEKRTAGVKPTEESPSRNEKQGSSVEGTIGVEGKDAGSIPVSHNLTEMTGDDIVNALASMLGGKEDLSDELTEDHCEAGLLDIEGKVEPGDSERREGSPDRTLVDQEGDAQQSTDVGMHDEQKSSETGNGSKNVANAESEWKDELKSFSLDQNVDIVCWMGGWSDIFLECEICKAHIYLYRIYRHLSSHREVMHCMNCNFWHVSESLFKAHLQSCQEKESSVCELCGESYKDVRLHMRLEHTYTYGKKKAKMKASKKKTPASGHTARKGILNRYVSLARRYRCTICRELFSSIHGFHKHMDGNHDMQGEAFRSGLLEILEEKTLQAVQKRLKELQTIRRKKETKLRKLQGLQKSGNLSECWQPSRVNDGSTGMHTRASNRRTEQEGVMVKRKDEGEGDCSHLSGEGKPENIHPPADEETPGTVQGDDGQGKDDGGLQNGYRGDYESSLSKKCSFEATALENPGELCVLEGEREKGSISCEGMTVEESLSRDTMMALNNVMEDQTALSFSEKTITGIIPAIATSPAEENSSRFEKQGSCDKGTISAEGTDAANIPISNESAEDDISDVLTSMLGGEKTLLSALTDEQFGTTCEAGLLNIGELEAGDSERREGSPDRTLVDQEENAEQSMDGGIHDEQNGVETDNENKNVATTDLGIIDEQETLATSNESRNVANACTETVLMDEPIDFSPDQDIDIIYWMEGWSDILMECDVCKAYVIFTQMGRHLNTHSKVMHCKYCHRLYGNKDLLKDHVAYCSSKKVKERYVCEYCGKSYTSITNHIRRVHSQVGTSFPCKLCDRSFSSSSKLRRHMESHSLVKSYTCTVCGRGFSQKNNLQGHMRQHTKEKPFKCSMCDKAFTHKVSLKNHIWRHHGIDMWVLNPSSSTGRPKKAGKKRKEGHTETTPKKRQRRKVK